MSRYILKSKSNPLALGSSSSFHSNQNNNSRNISSHSGLSSTSGAHGFVGGGGGNSAIGLEGDKRMSEYSVSPISLVVVVGREERTNIGGNIEYGRCLSYL